MTNVIHIKNAPRDWKSNTQYVYIGRSGKGLSGYFGNPERLKCEEDREKNINRFEEYCITRMKSDREFLHAVASLNGKTLVCFCNPKRCHGDVYVKLCNRLKKTYS